MPQRLFTTCCALVTCLSCLATNAVAQHSDEPYVIGHWYEIESEVLSETRRFIVSNSLDDESSDEPYLVMYLLDGPFHFEHTAGLVDFMVSNGLMPKTLVVAIENTNRTRDLTPPASDDWDNADSTAGGANEFIQFFRDELIPYIDEHHHTSDYRILVGHSYGGLFAVHTLVHQPDLFDAYIAISPSLQWDNQALVDQADEFFQEHETLNKSFYMTSGNEGAALTGGVLKLAGILEQHSPIGFSWDKRIMPEESHGSVVHRSTRQGLDFIFSEYELRDPATLFELGGVEALHAFYHRASERYGAERKLPMQVVARTVFDLMESNRLDEARDLLEHDTENYPPIPFFYIEIAKKHEDTEKAIDCYRAALERNPASREARAGLEEHGIDPDSIVPPVEIPEKVLASYAGTYTRDEQGRMTSAVVSSQEDLLIIELPMFPEPSELVAISQTKFSHENEIYTIEFTLDEEGTVTSLMLHPPIGEPVNYERDE